MKMREGCVRDVDVKSRQRCEEQANVWSDGKQSTLIYVFARADDRPWLIVLHARGSRWTAKRPPANLLHRVRLITARMGCCCCGCGWTHVGLSTMTRLRYACADASFSHLGNKESTEDEKPWARGRRCNFSTGEEDGPKRDWPGADSRTRAQVPAAPRWIEGFRQNSVRLCIRTQRTQGMLVESSSIPSIRLAV